MKPSSRIHLQYFALATSLALLAGCGDSGDSTGPETSSSSTAASSSSAEALVKDSIEYELETEDTLPSFVIQLFPKVAGFDASTNGYITLRVANHHSYPVTVSLDGSITGFTTVGHTSKDIPSGGYDSLVLWPLFQDGKYSSLTEFTAASYDLTAKVSHGSDELTLIQATPVAKLTARDVMYWADPETGEDLSFLIAGWVTPHAPAIDVLVRLAAEYHPDGMMVGYQGGPDDGTIAYAQVKAVYDALQNQYAITYINAPISYPEGTTQRIKFPSDALATSSANCIDGTVLMASALESIGLHPIVVLIPGHAFLGWETYEGTGEYNYVETTMLGSDSFENANLYALEELLEQIELGNYESGLVLEWDIHALRTVIPPLVKRSVI